MNTKTRLLSKIDLRRSEDFVKDLMIIIDLPQDAIDKLPNITVDAISYVSTRESRKFYEDTAKGLNIAESTLVPALGLSQFFLREFAEHGDAADDTPEDLIYDIVNVFKVPEGKAKILSAYFARLKECAKANVERTIMSIERSQAILPIIKSVDIAVDFRAVFTENYSSSNVLDKYSPTCLGTVAIGIIEFGLANAPSKSISLQVNSRSLTTIIEYLCALQKQMEVAAKQLNIQVIDHAK